MQTGQVIQLLPKAIICVLLMCVIPSHLLAQGNDDSGSTFFVDAVVASVNGVPITLNDVMRRVGGTYPKSLSEAAQSEKIQYTLQQMITEYLLKAEAQERRLGVSTEELNRYIERVAQTNGLSIEEFEAALKDENKSLAQYREQVEVDILRTKLASSILRQGVTVGDSEIDEYIEGNNEFQSEGSKIKLRQIVLLKSQWASDDAREKLQELRGEINSLDDFTEAAEKNSQGPEATEGGLLGVLSEEELSSDIFDALFQLEDESVSEIVETGGGYHLFFVEDRYVGEEGEDEDQENLREEVRTELEKRKLDEKLRLYFAQELTAKFAVDKKI